MTPLEIMARGYCEEGARQGVHIDQACCEERMGAALQALDAAGWVVVPKEATEEMAQNALTVNARYGVPAMRNIHKAMIEAGAYKV